MELQLAVGNILFWVFHASFCGLMLQT